MTTQFEGWDTYQTKVRNGLHHQSMRNMLQRNNRERPRSATSVRWPAWHGRTGAGARLIADLDLDGNKDIFVTQRPREGHHLSGLRGVLANRGDMKAVTNNGRSKVDFLQLTKAMSTTRLRTTRSTTRATCIS